MGSLIGRSETLSAPKNAGMEACGIAEWQEMIKEELSGRRDWEKKSVSLQSEKLKLQLEIWKEQKVEREEKWKQRSSQLELMSSLVEKMT